MKIEIEIDEYHWCSVTGEGESFIVESCNDRKESCIKLTRQQLGAVLHLYITGGVSDKALSERLYDLIPASAMEAELVL